MRTVVSSSLAWALRRSPAALAVRPTDVALLHGLGQDAFDKDGLLAALATSRCGRLNDHTQTCPAGAPAGNTDAIEL